MVFVEVKAKSGASCGSAREAVTRRKRRQVISMATDYLWKHRAGLHASGFRFDVVAVTMRAGQPPLVEIIRNAFTLNDA